MVGLEAVSGIVGSLGDLKIIGGGLVVIGGWNRYWKDWKLSFRNYGTTCQTLLVKYKQ